MKSVRRLLVKNRDDLEEDAVAPGEQRLREAGGEPLLLMEPAVAAAGVAWPPVSAIMNSLHLRRARL